VDITNATPPVLSYDVTSFTLGITNNAHVVGVRTWTNALTSESGELADNIATVPLGVGANVITVIGTNEWNVSASDNITVTRGGIGTGTPFVDITNATPPTLSYDVTSFTLGITNNDHVVGTRTWTNMLTSESGELADNIATVPLGVGANEITVTGTNEWNVSASDSITVTRGDIGTGTPFVDITNATPPTLSYDVASFTFGITNNEHVVGVRTWTNALTSESGAFEDNIAAIPLGVGANEITVTGTNEWGVSDSDSITIIRGDIGTGVPYVDITNDTCVLSYGASVCTIGGTNNIHVQGDMWWSNTTALINGNVARSIDNEAWTALIDQLPVGSNMVAVYGTNALGWQSTATLALYRKSWAESAPQIATNALLFPAADSVLDADNTTSVVWNAYAITDDIDGTNLVITRISAHPSNDLTIAWLITNEVNNLLGQAAWFVPGDLVDGTTNYVIRFEVVDSSWLTNSMVFFSNPFTVIPEPWFAAALLAGIACMTRCRQKDVQRT